MVGCAAGEINGNYDEIMSNDDLHSRTWHFVTHVTAGRLISQAGSSHSVSLKGSRSVSRATQTYIVGNK